MTDHTLRLVRIHILPGPCAVPFNSQTFLIQLPPLYRWESRDAGPRKAAVMKEVGSEHRQHWCQEVLGPALFLSSGSQFSPPGPCHRALGKSQCRGSAEPGMGCAGCPGSNWHALLLGRLHRSPRDPRSQTRPSFILQKLSEHQLRTQWGCRGARESSSTPPCDANRGAWLSHLCSLRPQFPHL